MGRSLSGPWEPLTGIGITFVIVQLTDNIFISPLIVSRSTNLHPLAVIIAVVIGAQLFAWSVCCWPYP